MKLYGDITKLSGYDLDPVDLIVGGSPCQDLSVAGKREGLEGERSGLFMEMIRVIKEMRNATNFIRPRYTLWENVPGAFTSWSGRDFQAVLTEFVRIVEPDAPNVPNPEEGWPKSGILLGPDWSLAWRTHDAQFWGVPQRRKRIALVMDFRGKSAYEILFERGSIERNTEQSKAQREGITGNVGKGTGSASEPYIIEMTSTKNTVSQCGGYPTLTARMGTGGNQVNAISCKKNAEKLNGSMVYSIGSFNSEGMMSENPKSGIHETDLARTLDSTGNDPSCYQGGTAVITFQEREGSNGKGGRGILVQNEKTGTISTSRKQHYVVATMQGFGDYSLKDVASSCKQRDHKDATDQVCRVTEESNNNYVRRLTPTECERLQGFPDGWTNIPGASDSARYKALGNSIALPFWEFLAHRFAEIGGVKTIGSLFDGISGFPLVFKRAGCETLWTSEIEPFCQKVCQYHLEKGDL